MEKKYKTIQQHEPLRVPTDFSFQGKRLIVQIEEILDDLYRRFNRIKLSDLGTELQDKVMTSAEGVKAHETHFEQTDEHIKTLASEQQGLQTQVTQTTERLESVASEQQGLQTQVIQSTDILRGSIQQGDKIVSELDSTVKNIEHWATNADGNVAELTSTVRGLESKVESAGGKVAILTHTADGLTSTVFGQGGELAQLKTRADEISAEVRDATGNIGSLSVKADNVTAKVKGAEGQISQLAVTADGLNYTLTKQGLELSSIKALIDEISLSVRDTNGAMGQFIVQSDRIAGKLTDASGKLTALQELTENRFRVVLGDIEVVEGDIRTITGSTLWQTRDSITGVVGKIEIDANGNVVVKQGSGLRVYENGTSVGVYNENNLTAGLMVQKLNGSTTAKIKADRIDLEGYVTITEMEAEFASLLDGFALEFSTTDLYASTITAGASITSPDGYVSANTLMASASITVEGKEVATQPWVNGRYNTMKIWVEANYATHGWTVDHFVQSTALTTETVKVLTSASFSATGEIAVRDADGNIIGTALTGGKVTYGTKEITYIKYA